MDIKKVILFLIIFSCVSGCNSKELNDSHEIVHNLILDPNEYPSECSFYWAVKPFPFEATNKYPNDFLGSVIGHFWFDDSVDLSNVTAGVSNVYSSIGTEFAISNIILIFKSNAQAIVAQDYLKSKYFNNSEFFTTVDGGTLAFFLSDYSVSPSCSKFLQHSLESNV